MFEFLILRPVVLPHSKRDCQSMSQQANQIFNSLPIVLLPQIRFTKQHHRFSSHSTEVRFRPQWHLYQVSPESRFQHASADNAISTNKAHRLVFTKLGDTPSRCKHHLTFLDSTSEPSRYSQILHLQQILSSSTR